MSYCPACGHPAGDAPDIRFCARCGRDLGACAAVPAPTLAVPPAPTGPVPPPPPTLPPGPPPAAGPSPAAVFARRVAAGRWERPVLAGALPALAVLAVALVIGLWTGVSAGGSGVGLATRTRVALALLLQGIGGSMEFTRSFEVVPLGQGFSDDSGAGTDTGRLSTGNVYHSSVSLVPWTVTLLWVAVLAVALYVLFRQRPPAERGADAAVRVSLAAAAAALVLGFAAQPTVAGTEVHTRPFVAALTAFALTLAVSLLVLCRTALDVWLAARPGPGPATAFRALGTAAAALLLTLLFAGAVVFLVAAAHQRQLTGWGVAGAGLLLVNLGVSGLGLAWGAPFRIGGSGGGGDGSTGISFGLSDLDHVWGGWSVAGTVAGGVGCALLIGVLAAWRSRDRVERFAVAAAYTGLFTLLAALSGVSDDGESLLLATGSRHTSMATSVPEAMAFALLWSFGGVACGPYVWRALGGRTGTGARGGAGRPSGSATERTGAATWGPATGAAPAAVPGTPPVPGAPPGTPGTPNVVPPTGPPAVPPPGPVPPTVHDLGIVQPDRLKKDPPSHR